MVHPRPSLAPPLRRAPQPAAPRWRARWRAGWDERLLAAMAVLVVLVSAVRAVHAWRYDSFLDHVSGAWAALAFDLSRGVFYRPLYTPGYYGGTRFFPLQFVTEGLLLRLGVAPRVAGYGLATLASMGLVVVCYALLRRWGAGRALAASCAGLVLAAGTAQVGLLAVRGDALPAALSLAALLAGVRRPPRPRDLGLAALLLSLAFASKETSLAAGLALVTACWQAGERRAARWLAALWAVGIGLVLVAIELGSHGRARHIFAACASGGLTLTDLLHAPVRLFGLEAADPGTAPFLVLGAAAALHRLRRPRPSLAVLYFAATLAITLLIVASPGTSVNHLLDLHVAALLVLGEWMTRALAPLRRFAALALTVAALVAAAPLLQDLHQAKTAPLPNYDRLAQVVGCAPAPVLSENPWFPVLAGQRPYLLDAFMFRLLRLQDPRFAAPLWARLGRGGFGMVILRTDPRLDSGQAWYRNMHFGPGFVEQLNAHYRLAATLGGQYLYLPRGPAGAAANACLARLVSTSPAR